MSSVDSTLNAASTLVTMDFIKKRRPDTSPQALVRIGRVVTAVCMVFAIAWSPVIIGFDTLWSYLQTTLAYVAPPALALFILGVFWPRANGDGALAGLAAGHLAALVFLVLSITDVLTFQFLYLPPILLTISMVVMAVVSLRGAPPPRAQTDELTWSPAFWRAETARLEGVPAWKNYRVQSLVLVALTAVVVALFW
jgi:SSS family solute:Na+ symporter